MKQFIKEFLMGDYLIAKRFWIFPLILWTVLVYASYQWNINQLDQYLLENAKEMGRNMFYVIKSMKTWNASHGGVYAPVTKDTQPDTFLNLPEREIKSTKGKLYTLINPANMTRQLSEITNLQNKISIHLISLKPISPSNMANAWESSIIKEFELGKIENIKLFHDGKLSEFRYIAVLKAEDTCLRCHARQGFKKGDIIGGTAITFPAEPVIILQKNKKLNLIFLHISIYLLVSLLSLYIFFRTRKQWMILKNIQNDQELRIQMRTFELEEAYIKLTKELKAHKETSDLLMKSEARLIAINDSALEAIITIDKESTIISWNHAAEEMFGYSQEEIIGKSLMIIMPETFREKHLKSINKYFHFPFGQGGIIPTIGKTVEFSGLKKDGSEFPIEISLASWKADDQIFFTGIIRNISKRKQLDKQLKELNHTLEERVIEEIEKGRKKEQILIQQSKMASMGEMISAIAHQWRQPLNALGLIIQDIKEAFHANELDQQYIEKSIKDSMDQIKMMSNTIDDFRDFFRKSKQRAPFNIIKSIKFTQSIFSAQLKNNAITINNIYNEDEDIIVNGFFNEFNQVILNIMSNAKDAIVEARVKGILGPEGGQIIIRALKEDDRAVLKIGNNGGPIPENLLDTIFEPYFTTKEEGKGTGIGLYMAKSIIEQSMNGKIFVENMGYGVIFTIYLDIYRE